jgi:hypothetical protein
MVVSNIEKVYSGRIGCMCGCQGKYSYNEGVPREAWQGDVNVRSVKIMARKVLTNPSVKYAENYAYVEENGRIRVVFFKQYDF